MKRALNNKKNHIVLISLRIFSIIIFLICSIMLLKWFKENNSNKTILTDIKKQVSFSQESENHNTEEIDYSSNFELLKSLNSDTVGWLKINNTDIDFPVVKGKDNSYYMNHNFNKEYNSAGWIFADYRNTIDGTDSNTIIYGHNRRDGSMFSSLNNVLEKSWYTSDENHIIVLTLPEKQLQFKVFSIYKVKSLDFDNSTSFKTTDEYQKYITTAINRSIYKFNENITTSDKILTIYTCANNNQYRIILHGKLITK